MNDALVECEATQGTVSEAGLACGPDQVGLGKCLRHGVPSLLWRASGGLQAGSPEQQGWPHAVPAGQTASSHLAFGFVKLDSAPRIPEPSGVGDSA